jgi:hypothetical protein
VGVDDGGTLVIDGVDEIVVTEVVGVGVGVVVVFVAINGTLSLASLRNRSSLSMEIISMHYKR